jgi:surface protein
MFNLFSLKTNFNEDISGWDVSNVKRMDYMFQGAAAFNQDIGSWNVSQVTDMRFMFSDAAAFNKNISQWDVSKVTRMDYMFSSSGFNNGDGNAPLVWNVSELVNASSMFREANNFNQKLNWTNSELKLENVNRMFYVNTAFNQNVNVLFKKGNKINNMEGMFNRASEWNNGGTKNVKDDDNAIDWYTDQVINMKNLFRGSGLNMPFATDPSAAVDPVDRFNTRLVQSFEGTFAELKEYNYMLGFLNTSEATSMREMFKDSPKFNDGNFLGIGCWDVQKVTDFTSMFENATNFRGKVHSWTLNSLATKQNGSFVDMFKNSGLAGTNAGIDLFQQKFAEEPSEEDFGYRFLEKDAGLVAWDPATGLPTGAYNRSMRSTNDPLRINFDPNGVNDPFTTSSGNALFNLDQPYNIAFYLRSVPFQKNQYPSYFAAYTAFVLGERQGENGFGMNVFDNDFLTRNTDSNTGVINATNSKIEEANKKLIFELVKFIDIGNIENQQRFGGKRIIYYEQGIFNNRNKSDAGWISYITLEKQTDGTFKWVDKRIQTQPEELLAPNNETEPDEQTQYIAISQNSSYQPTQNTPGIALPLCNVPHKFEAGALSGLLTTNFGAWFVQNYQTVPEYQAVYAANGSSFSNPTVVEYILTLLDRHVVNIDGADKLVDTNFKIYDMTGADLNQTYSEPFYGSNMVDDYSKPLDRLRLLANIDFSPQTVGIYSVYVPFCEKNSDGDNIKNYRQLYPSDLQQLYSAYFSDAGSICQSFACGSPNYPGEASQTAEDDADYFFSVLAGVFAGINKNQVLINGFQDLRLVYFERGYHNPLNGYDGQVGTNTQPYVSYVLFKDGQLTVKKKQTVLTDGLKGLYAFIKQVPLTSYIKEWTITTDSNGFKNRSFDQGKTDNMLATMVNDWYNKVDTDFLAAESQYGPIKYWILDNVSTLESVFLGQKGTLHPDIGYWNVKNIKSIKDAFRSSTFNGKLANWERSFPEILTERSTLENVTNMEGTFFGTTEFKDDIGGWVPDSALTMKDMFKDAAKFDQSTLCKWAPADENIVLTNMFGYTTTETPMFKNGPSYGFKVPTPDFVQFGNCAPKFLSTPVTTAKEGEDYSYSIEVEDPDKNSVVTVEATTKPNWVDLALAPANTFKYVLSGRPTISDVGSHNVVLTATDGSKTTTQSFTIVVSARDNNAPVFTSVPVTFAVQDTPYNAPDGYKVTATDSDGDEVTIVANTIPSWATYSGGVLSGTPANKDVGTYPVKFTATDGRGGEAVQEFTITVQNVNDAPVFTSTPPTTARQESLYSYKVTTSDPDVGDVVTVTTPIKPDWLSFNPTTNTLSGTPPKTVWGNVKVRLRASDGGLDTDQEFTIMVKKPICFNQGTKILCFKNGKEQYISVEQLREGDQVKTLKHGYKKIIDMRKGTFKLNGLMDMGMYRMKKQGNMIADLEMTGLHAMLVDKDDAKYADDIKRQGGLNKDKYFVDDKFRLRANQSHEFQQMAQKEYTIYSFALEEQQKQYGIWANGLLVETTRRKMLEVSSMERVRALEKSKSQ